MYESQTSDVIEKRMLAAMSDSIDKREGSIAYDATAPASLELAEAYIMADIVLKEVFATSSDREYLVLRAAEFNMSPNAATYAEVKAQFNEAVSLGQRFNYDNINFAVTELISDTEHTYKMVCETAGTAGNVTGSITPITSITGLTSAQIIEIITPAEDDEETEVFRKRYFAALKSQAYGGNGADYVDKVTSINGVGGCKVYRCWNGGGTVKCVVLASDNSIPSADFVAEIQAKIDPPPQGQGYGLAPIGHTVTISAATATAINVAATVTTASGVALADITNKIKAAIEAYFLAQRKLWCDQADTEALTIRTAYIESKVLEVTGVVDISNTKVNGASDRVTLDTAAVPVLGTVTLTAG